MKVLIVDDNHLDRKLLRYNAEKHGYLAVEAQDGEEALQVAFREKPDFIVSDVLMPQMDGFELLREVRSEESLRDIPFVFYSAVFTGKKEENLAAALGADAFLVKPIEPEKLWRILMDVIGNRRRGIYQERGEILREEDEFLRKYSKVVATKLEEKVHELQEAKARIEEHERRYRNLFNSLRDVVVVADEERNIIDVNQPALREMFGYELDEICRQKAKVLYATESEFEETGRKIFGKKDPVKGMLLKTTMRRKNGEIFPCEISAFKLLDEKGGVHGNIGIIRDLSGEMAAQEKIRRARDEWERTFNAIPDIVTLQDTNFRILRANKATGGELGVSPDELVGRYCYEVFRGINEPCEGCPVEEMMNDGEPYVAEIYHPRLKKIFTVSATPIYGEDGNVSGIAHFAKDVTEQKNLASQLLQAQKMEAVGNLAGGVAHDFNNILTAIQGYLELAIMQLGSDNSAMDELQQVRCASDRAANLVKQLLLFSRRKPMDFILLNLNRSIEELLKMLRRIIGEDIEIVLECAPDCWPIKGDPTNIDQVIVNLAVNARDAMPRGGTLTIRTENVVIDEEYCSANPEGRLGDFVCLSIIDEGIGMSEEIRKKIFEPFFTTKDQGKGTGLGLAVVFGIVQAHNGWIQVVSAPGHGSRFRMYFPRSHDAPAAGADSRARDLARLKGKGERVLIVEDDVAILTLAANALRQYGYDVVAVERPDEAFNIFVNEKGRFDLVLSDLVMPGMSGIDLVDRFEGERPGLPVLMWSGYADKDVLWPQIRERGYAFLEKPFSVLTLLRTVREILTTRNDK